MPLTSPRPPKLHFPRERVMDHRSGGDYLRWGTSRAIANEPDGGDEFTVEAIFRPDTTISSHPICGQNANTSTGWYLYRSGSSDLQFWINDTNSYSWGLGGLTAGRWYYAAFVYSPTAQGDYVKAYGARLGLALAGTEANEAFKVGTSHSLTADMSEGNVGTYMLRSGWATEFDGKMAMLRVWRRALSEGEIRRVWNQRWTDVKDTPFPSLAFYYDGGFGPSDVGPLGTYRELVTGETATATGPYFDLLQGRQPWIENVGEKQRWWAVLAAGAVNATRTATDTVFSLLGDSTARQAAMTRSPADSVSSQLNDSTSRQAGILRAASDSVFSLLADSVATVKGVARSVTDSVFSLFADSTARQAQIQRAQTDTVSSQLADSTARQAGMVRTASDSVFSLLNDVAVGIKIYLRTATDSVFSLLSDSAARQAQLQRAPSDSVSSQLNDTTAKQSGIVRTAADSVFSLFSDAVTAVRLYLRSATDAVFSLLGDSTARQASVQRAPSDSVFSQLTDSVSRAVAIGRTLADSVFSVLGEVVSAIKTLFGTPTGRTVTGIGEGRHTTVVDAIGDGRATSTIDGVGEGRHTDTVEGVMTVDNEVNFPASLDVAIGQDIGLGIPVVDGDGDPVDCSGFAMLWELSDKHGQRKVAKLKSVAGQIDVTNGNGTNDKVVPRLLEADTITAGVPLLDAERHYHELWRIDSGSRIRLARGYVDIQPTRRLSETS